MASEGTWIETPFGKKNVESLVVDGNRKSLKEVVRTKHIA
jgi:hypothetical protein